MVLIARPIEMQTARDVVRRLDAWAERHLADCAGWADALVTTRWWLDYSTRNQLLLASYGAQGPAAGIETWRLVPAVGGRSCAVAAGEHGLPIRVPVTEPATQPDPYVGGARRTAAAVERWEWRSVFCEAQLARRPDSTSIHPSVVPDGLTGESLTAAVRTAADRTFPGPTTGGLTDLLPLLTASAARHRPPRDRPALDEVRASQVAHLVLARVGRTTGGLVPFDPTALSPRERWEQLGDVLEATRRLTIAVGQELGVDLCASGLPRMAVVDDRVVPPGRQNRLPQATIESLPLHEWVGVGPYTEAEWQGRGEQASGRGAYRRISETAYFVAVEQGEVAHWRLEDTRSPIGSGVAASGLADSLADAQATAVASTQPEVTAEPPDLSLPMGWKAVDDRPGALRRDLDHGLRLYVVPNGPRWLPFLANTATGRLQPLDHTATRDEALAVISAAGQQAARDLATDEPVTFDQTLDALARSPRYRRADLVQLTAGRLGPDQQVLLATDPRAGQLVELLQAAGATPATTAAVLAAEQLDAVEAATLLPTAGFTATTAMGVLTDLWDLDRVTAAELVGADATEMRAAGCTASEILTARPVEVLARLPPEPELWDRAAGTMRTAGHTDTEITDHLTRYAPNSQCFAAGIVAAVDDPTRAFTLALDAGIEPAGLTEISERYGRSPTATALALEQASATVPTVVAVLFDRCDHDPVLTVQLTRSALKLPDFVVTDVLAAQGVVTDPDELQSIPDLDRDRYAWARANLAHRPRPLAVAPDNPTAALVAALPPAASTREDGLLQPPEPVGSGTDALIQLPEPLPARPEPMEIDT